MTESFGFRGRTSCEGVAQQRFVCIVDSSLVGVLIIGPAVAVVEGD